MISCDDNLIVYFLFNDLTILYIFCLNDTLNAAADTLAYF